MSILGKVRGLVWPYQPATIPFRADFKGIRQDGWANDLTGLGTARDKAQQGYYLANIRLDDPQLSALYHHDDISARIVEFRPNEMLRRGYELGVKASEGDEKDQLEQLEEKAQELKMVELFRQASIWGRLFGGALLLVGADDGNDPSLPLNEKTVKSVRWLNVIDRRYTYVHRYYSDPFASNYGQPELYAITSAIGGTMQGGKPQAVIHESRVIRFDGAPTDLLVRQQLAGWTFSVLQRPYEQIMKFSSGFQAAAHLLSDASQGVFKIQGLMNMIASGESSALQQRMAFVDMSRSVARALLLDSEGEDFERATTSFAGVSDLLDRFMMRLAAAAEMPVTILMGRSPAGQNATGDSDFRMFYDTIASEQENVFTPRLTRLYSLLAMAADSPAKGLADKKIIVKWRPLWSNTDTEQADIELKYSQRDVAYITAGVLLPEEVAISRFGLGRFNPTTEIDVEERKAALEKAVSFDPYPNDPEPDPQLNATPGQGEPSNMAQPKPNTGTKPNAAK